MARLNGPNDGEDEDLYLRPPTAEGPRSRDLPLTLEDDATRGAGGRPEPGLLYEPLEETQREAAASPVKPVPVDGSPLLFRLALSTAALLALLVLARGFWWPEGQEQGDTLRRAVAPSPSPAETPAPPPAEPAAPEPTLVDEMAGVAREAAPAVPPQPRNPEPVVLEEAPPQPAPQRPEPKPVPEQPAARSEPLARRLPEPWEEGPEVPGLLKPGPGVEEPVPLDFPAYSYPAAARGTGLKAEVRLALLVDEQGRVIEARVREGAPPDLGFAETALAVGRRIPFQPARRHAVPGKMWTEVILEFAEEATLERHRSR